MKYVMFAAERRALTVYVPIIFPNELVHADVAKYVGHMLTTRYHADCGVRPVSAGAVLLRAVVTSGRSETLRLNAREEDADMINLADYGGLFR